MSLQVLHPLTDVLAHGQKPGLFQSPAPLPQDVQQTAVLHELSHDQQGALLQANTIQLHQLRVAQPPERDTVSLLCDDNKEVDKTCRPPCPSPSLHHNLGLFNEVLLIHGCLSNGLDGHFLLSSPLAKPHQTKLAAAELLHEG